MIKGLSRDPLCSQILNADLNGVHLMKQLVLIWIKRL